MLKAHRFDECPHFVASKKEKGEKHQKRTHHAEADN
jgi:hypothetical protein